MQTISVELSVGQGAAPHPATHTLSSNSPVKSQHFLLHTSNYLPLSVSPRAPPYWPEFPQLLVLASFGFSMPNILTFKESGP